jgi:hypothetical protein
MSHRLADVDIFTLSPVPTVSVRNIFSSSFTSFSISVLNSKIPTFLKIVLSSTFQNGSRSPPASSIPLSQP